MDWGNLILGTLVVCAMCLIVGGTLVGVVMMVIGFIELLPDLLDKVKKRP